MGAESRPAYVCNSKAAHTSMIWEDMSVSYCFYAQSSWGHGKVAQFTDADMSMPKVSKPEDWRLLMLSLVIQPVLDFAQLVLEALTLLVCGDGFYFFIICQPALSADDVSLQLVLGLSSLSLTHLCLLQLLHVLPSCLHDRLQLVLICKLMGAECVCCSYSNQATVSTAPVDSPHW